VGKPYVGFEVWTLNRKKMLLAEELLRVKYPTTVSKGDLLDILSVHELAGYV